MGLVSGLIFGIILGIALMAGWKRMMRYRCTKRVSKAVDIKLFGSLSRDDLKKICGDSFPQRISFSDFEQVKWLNKQLSKIWPFVADAAAILVKESVEPLLDEYCPAGITSIKFNKFFLGTVPPKIEGIRVQNLEKGQIIMDLDFKWGGDPSIILGVEAALVASLPIQLKDLEVYTVIRIIFQLAEEIPCISAVVIALLSEPKPIIKYILKAVGGSLTAIPAISDMIDDTVHSIVADMLQWPHRIVVPIGGLPVDTSELELKPQGKLTVRVCNASDLKNMEVIGKSDPYVVLHVRPVLKVRSQVVKNNLNPTWNETFDLIVEDKETQSLTIEVLDKDVVQDKRLGIVKLPVNHLKAESEQEITLRLLPSLDTHRFKDKRDRGTIFLKVFYHKLNKEEQMGALDEEKRALEERKRTKETCLIGSTMDALDGAVSVVGTGVGAGVGLVGTGVGAGVGLVGTGVGAGVGLVGTGVGILGGGVSKTAKLFSRKHSGRTTSSGSGSTTPVSGSQESKGFKLP